MANQHVAPPASVEEQVLFATAWILRVLPLSDSDFSAHHFLKLLIWLLTFSAAKSAGLDVTDALEKSEGGWRPVGCAPVVFR